MERKQSGEREYGEKLCKRHHLPSEIRCPKGANTHDLKKTTKNQFPVTPQNTSVGGWETKASTFRNRQLAIALCSSAKLLETTAWLSH